MNKIELTSGVAYEYTEKGEILEALIMGSGESLTWKKPAMMEAIEKINKLVLVDSTYMKSRPSIIFRYYDKYSSSTKECNYYSTSIRYRTFVINDYNRRPILEYYMLKRDDDRTEKLLKTIHLGCKLYSSSKDGVEEETVLTEPELCWRDKPCISFDTGKAGSYPHTVSAEYISDNDNSIYGANAIYGVYSGSPLFVTEKDAKAYCKKQLLIDIERKWEKVKELQHQITELRNACAKLNDGTYGNHKD